MATYRGQQIDLKPSTAMANEAERALEWRREFGRGGTEIGVARARDIKNRKELSADTVRRMLSFFARHEVDKKAEGFRPGENGYPSAGRIAWGLWGGDAGFSWARGKVKSLDRIDEERKSKGYKNKPKTLYVQRKVLNAAEITRWAKSQGFETTLPEDDLHVTVAYSRAEVDWDDIPQSFQTIRIAGSKDRQMKALGETGDAKVLGFKSRALYKRWSDLREKGASWDFPDYQPHVTISYGATATDLAAIKAYDGEIMLGPEIFAEVDEGWKDKLVEKADLKAKDFVSWNTSGGRARGRIERIERNGTINVPDSDFTITGTEDDPAALIVVWREGSDGWAATDRKVGHKLSALTKIGALTQKADRSSLSGMIEVVQRVAIKKIDDDKRVVYGEVYAPYVLDTHGEFMTPEDIELMAHRFMKLDLGAVIDTNHDNNPNGSYPIESFIAREGDPDYTPGAWVLGVKVPDDSIWRMVKSGELNGFSFQSLVKAKEVEVDYAVVRDHIGETEDHGDHTHVYFVELDSMGRVIRGRTDNVLGHAHNIVRASVTETAAGHTHRFFL
jgi:hypothetical protein